MIFFYKSKEIENYNIQLFNIIKPYNINNINNNEVNLDYSVYKEINIKDIIKLFYSDYVIFLTNKYLNKHFFNIKNSLLQYFTKYNIVYFDYKFKNKIMYLVNSINNLIKYADEETKKNLIKIIISINDNFIDISKKMKSIYFSESILEPYILYKKIQFSNQEIFIPFSNYIIKKMEYKIRTFCQIAEKLGAEKIIIEYTYSKDEDKKININLGFLNNNIGTNVSTNNSTNDTIQIVFEYPDDHLGINLNKYYIIESIMNENEFLIPKNEFESELELKFLIDARCINFIQKYNTVFIMNYVNKIEQKILLKAYNYGLNIGNLSLKNSYIKISIQIDFVKIQNNISIIDGTNIHILREGFINLCNIVKKDGKYNKILSFLKSHLYGIHKKWISLNYDYDNLNYIHKIYHYIIDLNFEETEINNIIELFFKNNFNWTTFKKFRDLILLGSDNKIDKLYFITFQFHDILNNRNHIMKEIKVYIQNCLEDFIKYFDKIKITKNKYRNSSGNILNNPYDSYMENFSRSLSESLYKYEDSYNNTENEKDLLVSQRVDFSENNIDDYNENFNIIEISSQDENSIKVLQFLINNKDLIEKILCTAYLKSFKFNNGLSNNIDNYELLKNTINNIINYYFYNDIKKMQLNLNQIINDQNSSSEQNYNLEKNVFNKLVNEISSKIVNNINICNISPSVNVNIEGNKNNDKISLYKRIQKKFIKFLIKYVDFENKAYKIKEKFNNSKNNTTIDYSNLIENNSFLVFLENHIKMNKIYTNYNKYKLFYTWDDFLNIKNYFLE